MKRIIALLLVFLMAVALAACAGSGGPAAGKDTQNEAPAQVPTIDTPESGTPAGTEEQAKSPDAAQEPEGQRILVAYFSCTGNTAPLAEYAAEITGADLYEIVAEVPYTDDDIAYRNSGCRANVEQEDDACRPAIGGGAVDLQDYDVVFIAFPIWWGKEPRIIDTFMESYDFSGKTMIPFCTSGSSGISTAERDLHAMTDDTVRWLTGTRFAAGTSKDAMQEWIDSLGLLE